MLNTPAPRSVERLRQASPTGRLLDLFLPDEEAGVLDQQQAAPAAPKPQATRAGRRRPTPSPIDAPDVSPVDASGQGQDIIRIVHQAIDNCKPLMRVVTVKKGTKVVYVPQPIRPQKQMQMAVKWIVEAAHKRKAGSTAPIHECLATELLLAFQRKGSARAKRDELHKLALDNRANVSSR